jgi:predicted SprT family Zn-dependent metalloprotease
MHQRVFYAHDFTMRIDQAGGAVFTSQGSTRFNSVVFENNEAFYSVSLLSFSLMEE